MKICADSGPSRKSHPTVSNLVFKEMRLTLYPCMPFSSYTLDKTEICKLIHVHCNINQSDNLMHLFVCDYCLQNIIMQISN